MIKAFFTHTFFLCLLNVQFCTVFSWGYECAGPLPGVYSRLSHWATFLFIERNICEHSVGPPEYYDCLKWTDSPTTSPTNYPTITPYPTAPQPTISPAPTHSPSYIAPPSSEPTTEALRDFLHGTSSGFSDDGGNGDGSFFDDAFFENNAETPISNADSTRRLPARQNQLCVVLLAGILSAISILC